MSDRPEASTAESLLEQLDPQQRRAVLAPRGPVVVVAGPGTGKTRTVTYRIAHGVRTGATPAGSVLAVTFTRRAAGEMRTRLAALGVAGVAARTFHSAATRQLRHFWPRLVGGPMPPLLASPRDAMAAVVSDMGWGATSGDRDHVPDVLAEVDWAKASLVAAEDYPDASMRAARKVPGGDPSRVAEAFAAYERSKLRHGRIDFNDILLILAAGLEDDVGAARQVQQTYRHLVVDEYQDISAAQQRLLEVWLGDSDDILVVGDPRQTIYSFAGATVAPMMDMPRRHPSATVVTLRNCYRCRPQILDLATQVVVDLPGEAAQLRSVVRPAARSGAGAAPVAPEPTAVTALAHADSSAENRWLAREVGMLIGPNAPSQIAVLVRTRSLLVEVSRTLAAAKVPVYVRDDRGFFERPEVREALALLRVAARLGTPDREGDSRAPVELRTRVVDVLSGLSWSPEGPTRGRSGTRDGWYLLDALVRVAETVQAGGTGAGATMADLVATLTAMAADSVEPELRAVTVTTMHGAKGREWDVVFLPHLVEGVIPSLRARSGSALDEERRLLYVAFTRARSRLFLSWHERGPRGTARSPSSLLPEGVVDEAQQHDPGRRPSVAGGRGGVRARRTPH